MKTPFIGVAHVELPVLDLDRAVRFYEALLQIDLARELIDGYPMAFFPTSDSIGRTTLALAAGDVYRPAKVGPIVYLRVTSVADVLATASALGAVVLYGPTAVSPTLTVAEIEDSEGNRLALLEEREAT
ncbi:MAG: VOC family protein [Gemmatimonadaceae bacterium]|nr:VOC family protein [Gemmatimonadaceae bacterium]